MKRKEHREFLKRKILGIRKREDLRREGAKKRADREVRKQAIKEERERKKNQSKGQLFPMIKNSKRDKDKKRHSGKGSWCIFGYLTKPEKEFLYRKYKEREFSNEEIREKISRDVKHLQAFVNNLKEKKKSKEEINRRFKEEFAKLLEELRCQKNANIVKE